MSDEKQQHDRRMVEVARRIIDRHGHVGSTDTADLYYLAARVIDGAHERDDIRATLATAQRERDEARASLASSRAEADGLRTAHVDIVSACKRQTSAIAALTTERDALRGEVERLRLTDAERQRWLASSSIAADTVEAIAAWLDNPTHGRRATAQTVEMLRSGAWRKEPK